MRRIATLAVVAAAALLAFGQTPAAQATHGTTVYTITQDGVTTAVTPVQSAGSVVDFYSYGSPTASSANTGLEQSNATQLLLHLDTTTGNVSLVFIHDAAGDGSGGTQALSVVEAGELLLPAGATWVVMDDTNAADPSDTYTVAGATWAWADCCTDGGAIGGLGSEFSLQVVPGTSSGVTEWNFLSGPAGGTEIDLDPTETVTITATFVPGEHDAADIEDVLEFFDTEVDAGNLEGAGPGRSADGRLGALRNMIAAAGEALEADDVEEACDVLLAALLRVDGESPPPDFAQGDAADELEAMLEDAREALGCD